MMHTFFSVGVTLAAVMFAGVAAAQYSGPTSTAASVKVQQILENPRDDQKVTVRGRLLRQIDDDEYHFSDGTGEIVVEIDDDDFPKDVKVDDQTVVELYGEVDVDNNRDPEIEVEIMRVVSSNQ